MHSLVITNYRQPRNTGSGSGSGSDFSGPGMDPDPAGSENLDPVHL